MMHTLICNIQLIALIFYISMHTFNRYRLIIIRTNVQTLDTQAFVISQKFNL